MFMNARPRPELNGFRTFVPARIVELSYHRPYSMTNHGTSSWRTLRGTTFPAAAPDVWSYHPGIASHSENYLNPIPQSLNPDSSMGSAAHAQTQVGSYSTISTPKMEGNLQLQPSTMLRLENRFHIGLQEIQSSHQESVLPLFMADTDPDGWILDHSFANSSRFLRDQYSSTACAVADESSMEIDDITSTSALAPTSPFLPPYETLSSSQSFGSSEVEMAAPYINAFEHGIVSCPLSSTAAISTREMVEPYNFTAGRSWEEMEQRSDSVEPCGMIMPFIYDGLQHDPSTLWPSQLGPSPTWSQQTAPPGTVSPQALSLLARSSPSIPGENSPISSSGWHSESSAVSQPVRDSIVEPAHTPGRLVSAKALLIQNSGSDMPLSTLQPTKLQASRKSQTTCDITHRAAQPSSSKLSHHKQRSASGPHLTALPVDSSPFNDYDMTGDTHDLATELVTSQESMTQQSTEKSQHPVGRVLRPRHKLPSDRKGEAYLSLHTNSDSVSNNSRKSLAASVSRENAGTKDSPRPSPVTTRPYPRKFCAMQRPLTSERREVRLAGKERREGARDDSECSETSSKINDSVLQRIAKDKFLLDAKREGKSYKQIRKEGCFTEAESTLRGRHRTLTKRPEERVRRPEWESNDLRLLENVVHKLAGDSCLEKLRKVSWKEVSNYIVENGGSYRFGNSTCRKKWGELHAKSSDQDLS